MEKMVVYLPIVAAIFWGATYVLTERVFQTLNVPTWMVIGGLTMVLVGLILPAFGMPAVDLKAAVQPNVIGIVLFAVLLARLADLSILSSIKYINATYAAMIEICYVLFVPIFSYLIFGYRNFNMTTIIGGLIIFAGVVIVIRGQYLTDGAESHATI